MNTQPIKTFLAKMFSSKEDQENVSNEGFPGVRESFDAIGKSVDAIAETFRKDTELTKIEIRIIEISNIARSTEFKAVALANPHEARKLRDELDALVLKSRNL